MSRKFKTLAELYTAEHRQLCASLGSTSADDVTHDVTQDGPTGEPWVKFAPADRVGLALSGGGIRSAIFNLGLLEALDQRGVLPLVDYLSTVSGGGYIGGFWTAWRSRTNELRPNSVFPHRCSTDLREGGNPDSRERPETRHLREFSRYLMPRIGLNEPEMWFALATIIGGMLPAVTVTLAAVALLFYAWLGAGFLTFWCHDGGAVVLSAVTLLLHVARRKKWKMENSEEFPLTGQWYWSSLYWSVALLTTAVGAWLVPQVTHYLTKDPQWGWVADATFFVTFGFEPALTWLALALLTAISWIFLEALCRAVETLSEIHRAKTLAKTGASESARLLKLSEMRYHTRVRRLRRGTVRDQLTSRYLSWALIAAGVAGLWSLSFQLSDWAKAQNGHPVASTGGLATVFTGLYIWLRDWLAKPDKQSKEQGIWRKLLQRGKASLPMAAATAGALLIVVFTVLLLRYYGLGMNSDKKIPTVETVWRAIGIVAGAAALVVLAALKIFDPAYFGLHDFYRSRIARAFLGAAFIPGPRWQSQQKETNEVVVKCRQEAEICDQEAEEAQSILDGPDLPEKRHDELVRTVKHRRATARYLRDFARRRSAGLGSEPSVRDNRYTVERPEDDLCLTDLPTQRSDLGNLSEDLLRLRLRPVHLICCTANNLSGDALSTLSRGGRSAVLSQRGISLGDDTHPPRTHDPELMLSAAQTASAAAFNSQMGEKSLRLGPASSFLMSAFNLRLGLWVMNPSNERNASDQLTYQALCLRRITAREIGGKWWRHPVKAVRYHLWKAWFELQRAFQEDGFCRAVFNMPGIAFFNELLGRSSALPEDHAYRLHLSDGGHFENLGLYELIRRHVRYLIVSDAGQDEEVGFDDLGNAIRRVREDFGVEIEIELAPMRPDATLVSEQHLVVGTIHYDGFEGSDKGTIVYFKPTLTGDEPGDIQQYRTRNRVFPHEPTSDQFFAEAQWESYRRLGEHIGQVGFAFTDLFLPEQRQRAETVFRQARAVWSTLPPSSCAGLQEVSEKLAGFDRDIAKEGPASLRAELWPELAATRAPGRAVPAAADPVASKAPAGQGDDAETLPLLVNALRLMEEAWRTLRLDVYWSHQSNLGVMNWFRRWWATNSLRRWWVPLSTVCGRDFREFIKINFDQAARDPSVHATDADAAGPRLELRSDRAEAEVIAGLAWKIWQQRGDELPTGKTIFEYLLHLDDKAGYQPLQVGLAFVEISQETVGGTSCPVAHWRGDHFIVPDTLAGAGVKSRFLDRLIVEMKNRFMSWIKVTHCEELSHRRDEAARQVRLELIGLYKSRGFVAHSIDDPRVFAEMHLKL